MALIYFRRQRRQRYLPPFAGTRPSASPSLAKLLIPTTLLAERRPTATLPYRYIADYELTFDADCCGLSRARAARSHKHSIFRMLFFAHGDFPSALRASGYAAARDAMLRRALSAENTAARRAQTISPDSASMISMHKHLCRHDWRR